MKIKGKMIILSLALAALLTGCGEVEESSQAAGAFKAEEAASVGSNVTKSPDVSQSCETEQKPEAREDSEMQTVADPRQVPKVQQTEVIQQTSETSVQLTEPPAETTDPAEPDNANEPVGELVTPENIDSLLFGFELYNDGHKNCWDQRFECAKLMLEAAAQSNAADRSVDISVSPEQLNEKESSGFMTWLKFDEPMSFRVGDTVISGPMLMMIDYDSSYYFFIGDIEEPHGMFELDSSYIPKILEAAGVSPV